MTDKKKSNSSYLDIINTIPKKFYQELAANEERKTPEEVKKESNIIQEKTNTWKEDLRPEDKSILNELNEPSKIQELNMDLQKAQGTVETLSKENKQTIETLDKLLEMSPKLEETIVIQTELSTENEKLKETDIGNEFGYVVGSLHQEQPDASYVELSIPEGERVISIGNTEHANVLSRRDASFSIIERFTIQNSKGDQITKLIGRLLPKKDTSKDPNLTFNAEKYGEQWVNQLTTEEKEAMKKYTETNSGMFGKKPLYTAINTYLRTGEILKGYSKDKLQEQITFMDKAINRASLSEEIKVYRLSDAVEFPNPTVGEINIDQAYRSTSLNRDVSGNSLFQKKPIRVEITIPKGTPAPYLDSITQVQGEKEILLPREAKLKITGTSTVQETRTILNSDTGKREPKLIDILVIQATVIK
ncbi:ADP-ribosyltransferase [Bacillus cereus group sp. MYBK234-1]|uniref:ADP-ribosyltransferase n=1 Tax=unclassified Bacillus cereus group TaxID=2750818 RepID=UPI003F7A5043